MAATAGIGGSVKIGAVTVADINGWSVSPKGATEETTAFGASGNWRTKVATVKEWSAKFDGFTNGGDTTGQLALINGLNSTFTFNFMINGTNQWSGSGILTGIDPKSSSTGLNEISFSVDGTGALTYS